MRISEFCTCPAVGEHRPLSVRPNEHDDRPGRPGPLDELRVDTCGSQFGDQYGSDGVAADLPEKSHRLAKDAGSGGDVGGTAAAAP